MSMISWDCLDSRCDSWPIGVSYPESDQSRPFLEFSVDLSVNFQRLNLELSEEDDDYDYCLESPKKTKQTFLFPEISNSTISTMLSEMLVISEPFMIEKIRHCAEQIEIQYRGINRPKILHMAVEIDVFVDQMPPIFQDDSDYGSGSDDEILEDSLDEIKGMIPASKSAVEALEIVKGEDLGTCGVCLDSVVACTEVVGMPCSHVYHGGCITRWLEISKFCPLCRFPMPSD